MARQTGRSSRSRSTKNTGSFTTHNGNTVAVKRTFNERRRASKEAKARRKAIARSSLPNNFFLRQVHRMHPKRMAAYWFSRDGMIMALKIAGATVVVCFVLLIGLFAYFRKDLPKINSLAGDKLGGSITYYDRTGKTVLWQDYNAVKRVPVKSDQMSQYIKQATVAIEDQHFYNEGAFNFSAIMRAGLHDVLGIGQTEGLQGGSTITQQLVKLNEQWTDNRTIGRKIKELILAIDLNREYSKKEILAGYLNIAPYGGIEYGCESAARDYFGTTCKDLTLAQSAMLAAIPQAPSYYSPYASHTYNPATTVDTFNKTALLNRQHYVLDQMVKLKMISSQKAAEAKKVDVLSQVKQLTPKWSGIKDPYFVLAAKQELEQKYGAATVQRGGWKVITTLNADVQDKANELVQQNRAAVERAGGDEEAMAIEDVPTGQIIGLVGGTDFNNTDHGKINYASQVQIAPGSSIKPYVYATLINDTNAGAGSVFYDSQGSIVDKSIAGDPGYPCTDHSLPPPIGSGNCLWDDNHTYPGPETIRYALGGSRNVPAVKAMIQAGIKNVQKTTTQMMDPSMPNDKYLYNCYSNEELTQVDACGPAAGIGDGAYLHLDDHVNGLATLGRLGKAVPRTYILKITDGAGKVVDQWHQPKGKQVINAQTAYIINNIMSDPRASYFNRYTKIQHWNGWDFAIKTGTTNFATDYLMTGWSTQYAVVSWAGFHTRNESMHGSSDTITYAMTAPMLKFLHQGKKPINWKQPKGIQELPAYVMYSGKGMMFGAEFPSPSKDLYPSWYKPAAGAGAPVTIDKVSNKKATSCTPPDAKEVVRNGNANKFSIDQFVNNGKSGVDYDLSAFDDVHSCEDTKPSVDLTVTNPSGGLDCDSDKGCVISAKITQGTHPFSTSDFPGSLVININGKTFKTAPATDDGQTFSWTWEPTANGKADITATITDSVLYQGTDSASVNTKVINKPKALGNVTVSTSDNTATITWSGGSPEYNVEDAGGNLICKNVKGTTCTTNNAGKFDLSQVTVVDSNGQTSSS